MAGRYVADIPTLKHCVAYGETIEEVMTKINEALEGVLDVLEAEGLPIPDNTNTIEYSINRLMLATTTSHQLEANQDESVA